MINFNYKSRESKLSGVKCFFILGFTLLLMQTGLTQEKKWVFSGYVKNMQMGLIFNDAFPDLQQLKLVDTFLLDQLIHHRLNAKWYINDKWTFQAGLRNRLFTGDLVKFTPNYGQQTDDASNDYFDLSILWLDRPSMVIHSVFDRLFLDYTNGNWEIRVGRQRINWGISNVWNPNDVFNAFSFTDFDYEEKPGSDAIRVKYYTGFASSVEVAAKAADNIKESVIAGLWKFNQWNYDFQLLSGWVKNEWVVGGGWAGNIKNMGFQGELSYFIPPEDQVDPAFSMTVGGDYTFKNSAFISGGLLYNSEGSTMGGSSTQLFTFELSARNLYPYRWSIFTQFNYPVTPLTNVGMAIIYSPAKTHSLFLNPMWTYSIKENWDLNLIGQIVFNKEENLYKSPLQAIFLRLKYSY